MFFQAGLSLALWRARRGLPLFALQSTADTLYHEGTRRLQSRGHPLAMSVINICRTRSQQLVSSEDGAAGGLALWLFGWSGWRWQERGMRLRRSQGMGIVLWLRRTSLRMCCARRQGRDVAYFLIDSAYPYLL